MNKTNLFGRLLNGYITDPLTQNFIIYFASYVLSAFLSSIPNIGLLPVSVAESTNTFLPAFGNCLLPTTVTLTVSTVFQNIAKAQELDVKLRVSILWPALVSIIYAYLHIRLSQSGNVILPWVAIVCAFVISALNLWTVTQIQREVNDASVNDPT